MSKYCLPSDSSLSKWDRAPFGLGEMKPKHFRDMLKVAWENKDNPLYAWKVLSRGVCDGCALGVAGLHDWTIDGVHLCMTRLNLLRLNTMPAMEEGILDNVSSLEGRRNSELRTLGRLAYPMVRRRGEKGFRRVSWDETFERLGGRLRAVDPKRMAFFVTARGVTNEVYYMAQKAARFLGTNHVDNAARLCHAPSTSAMKRTLGIAATTCSYSDWIGSDLIVFFGSNPANDQPVSTKYLHEAKEAGTKVALVNPYREPGMERYWVPSTAKSALFGTDIMDYWYPVAQGGDIAFLSGVMKVLIEENWLDTAFIDEHTEAFRELKSSLQSLSWERLTLDSGLPVIAMRDFAELIARAKNAVLVWSMGITQHSFGADAVQSILNLGLLRGYLGRDKSGLMPIRGHSSVQGGAEMGAYCTVLPGGVPIDRKSAAALSRQYGFPIPSWKGYTAVEMLEAADRGKIDFLYSVGGNFLRTLPDPDHVRSILERTPVRVHQDIVLTDQSLVDSGDEVWLLPAKTRYEQTDGGTETSTERRVMFSPEIPRQVGEARSEWEILRDVAAAAYPERRSALGCESGWAMREEIAKVVPMYEGVQHLRQTGDAFQYGGAHLCPEGQCPTESGRARFHPVELPNVNRSSEWYWVSTRRGKQFNTLIYAEVDPFNEAPRDAILMSSQDAEKEGVKHEDRVELVTHAGASYCGRVWVAPIANGNLQVHWPEGNQLIARGVKDAAGGVPDYNARVRLQRIEP